ncbi:tryptophan--tRNA ligase [Rickettsiales bacterium (ex Bugula neritina AB1)]|nr:tryptophan--tRNA ligase [Rickettsiales bacterium (ex Bugula neritina AB1)]
MGNSNSIISGIQPTGDLHIGNYIGIFHNLYEIIKDPLYKKNDIFIFLADLHAMTIPNKNLKSKGIEIIKWILSTKINGNLKIYFQSDITNITKGYWFLSTFTHMGEMNRMTQFKEKSELGNSNVGLYTYPILMAADILYVNARFLGVGEDQKQHLEITRDISIRINNYFSRSIFTIPELLPLQTFRIKSLNNINKKMSKSNPDGCLFLKDDPKTIYNKIKKAITDKDTFPTNLEDLKKRPEAYNLGLIYSVIANISLQNVINKFSGYKWSVFKEELSGVVIHTLTNLQKNYKEISDEFVLQRTQKDIQYINSIVDDNIKKTYNLMFQ